MSENGRRVIAAVRTVAARNPNHVFSGLCRYVNDRYDCAECLIGHGLWDAGLIHAEFRLSRHNKLIVLELQQVFGFDDDETAWLQAAQNAQDRQREWGGCILEADRKAPIRLVDADTCGMGDEKPPCPHGTRAERFCPQCN